MRFRPVVVLAMVVALVGAATVGAGAYDAPTDDAPGGLPAGVPDGSSADARGGPTADARGGPTADAWSATEVQDDAASPAPDDVASPRPAVRPLENRSELAARYDQVIDVRLLENGDARWTVTVYEPLETENEREAFRDLGERWEAQVANVEFDVDLFREYVDLASTATGRSMSIPEESVRRNASVRDGTGALELTFTWTNFARQDGDRLVVDDAFRSPSGTWLPRLEDGQMLVIRPPEGFVISDSPPGPGVDNHTIQWEGPRTFSPTYFVEDPLVYRLETTPPPTPPPTPTPTPTPPSGSDFPRGLLFGIVAAVLVGGAMAVYRSRSDDLDVDGSAGESEPDGDEPDDVAGQEQVAEPDPEDPFAGVDEELLSDDERVLRLLASNGGRMKQGDIVDETDWSNAKVSQLLSSMAEEGEVDKLRIGRENLISLPDVDVEDVEE